MKVMIVVPPIREEGTPWYFPTGPGMIAAALDNFHEVKVLELKAQPKSKSEIEKEIAMSDSAAYLIGGMVTEYRFIKWFAETVKKYSNAYVIVGGNIATSIPHLLLNAEGVDYLVMGEGEVTIKELIDNLETKLPVINIKGIAFRSEDKIVIMPPREECNVDNLPIPAYYLFPTDVYLSTKIDSDINIPRPKITLITARGCPYQCTFCHRNTSGKTRLRSAEKVIEEIKFLIAHYHIKGFVFNDELTITDRERMLNICAGLKPLNLKWGCTGRVNLLDKELLQAMKDAGCVWMTVGIESANQRMLNSMKKGITVEQADKAFELCKEVGIELSATFIFGMPGENEGSIKSTINFFNRHDLPVGSFFTATPFPGTELWDLAKKIGKITPDTEEEYVLRMENMINFTINLTDWSDVEFMIQKRRAEDEIQKAYYDRHPLQLIKDNLHSIRLAPRVLKKYGIRKTLGLAMERIRRTMVRI